MSGREGGNAVPSSSKYLFRFFFCFGGERTVPISQHGVFFTRSVHALVEFVVFIDARGEG